MLQQGPVIEGGCCFRNEDGGSRTFGPRTDVRTWPRAGVDHIRRTYACHTPMQVPTTAPAEWKDVAAPAARAGSTSEGISGNGMMSSCCHDAMQWHCRVRASPSIVLTSHPFSPSPGRRTTSGISVRPSTQAWQLLGWLASGQYKHALSLLGVDLAGDWGVGRDCPMLQTFPGGRPNLPCKLCTHLCVLHICRR